jgi:carbamate kinase
MDEETARELATGFGWSIAVDKGGWRRVVPSPTPLAIVEQAMIATLFSEGHLVIAAGGGGTPVYRHPERGLEGIDAVVDKDRAAAVLAAGLDARVLLILTDVDAVYARFGTARQAPIRRMTVAEATRRLNAGEFGVGSMAPKVEAAIRFVGAGGERAIISRLDLGREAVAGGAGTEVVA